MLLLNTISSSARPRIVAIQVGLPKQLGNPHAMDPTDQAWMSGIDKAPVTGPVRVGRLNLEGDGQADLVHHGGPDKAVLAYSADHYGDWRGELEIAEFPHGAFGENLTVQGLVERDVCIGDIWRIGEVLLQVSQPRQPCWKLGRRWRIPDLPKRVLQTGRSGWYLRVLREGTIESGMEFALQERPYPQWTVLRTASLRYDKQFDPDDVAALAGLQVLATSWRDEFARRVSADRPQNW